MTGSRAGPTSSLALALFHEWEPERLFVIVTIYIDESGTHDSGLTILGGWVGRLGQWATFDPKWRGLLKRNGLTHFHAKKMRQSKGEFKGWKVSKKLEFARDAARLALKTLEFGFTISLRDEDYQQHYVADNRPREVQLDSRYGLCFRYCLGIIPGFADEAFKGRDLDINFVLESGHRNYGDAVRIFDAAKHSDHPDDQNVARTLRTIAFADKAEFPGLQMADVTAYSMFQHRTRLPLKTIPIPLHDPVKGAKKIHSVPVFHLQCTEHDLKRFRRFVQDSVEERKARRKPTFLSRGQLS